MLAMRTPCNSSSNFNCIDNVSKQRSDFEVTTISPAPRNRSRHVTSNKSTSDVVRKEGERCHCAFAKTYTKTFAGDDDMDPVNYKYTSRKNTHCQKTLVNYFCYGVDTIPSCFASQTRFCTSIQSKKFKWLSHVFITFILVFTLHSTSMPAFASSMSKSPLIRIDATERKNLFRTFTGQGPMERIVKPSKTHSDVPHDHAPRPTSILKKKPLDFQTLKVVERWGSDTTNVLLISGRDYIYMINATTDSLDDEIRYVQRLKWSSPPESMATCQLMGKQKHECNNFIRVVVLKGDQLYVCGTNSYDPRCRFYSRNDFASPPSITNGNTNFRNETACRGQCECPYNPAKASANLYTATANGFQLFSAVINDFMGKQPVLMRKNNPYVYSVERWFNDPTFIKMVESDDGKIYLFFREVATAVETGSSSPTTYARVAQVCKNDVGGSTVLRLQWTTFLKARLKCSISGSADGVGFDFNNLTSVSEITQILGQDGRPMNVVFATFTTPWEWSSVSMSAVCVYSIQTISNLFKLGNFFGEQELHSGAPHGGDAFDTTGIVETLVKAMPVPNYEVPVPRPGLCHDRSTTMSDKSLHFAEEHFLMYGPVMPLYQQPMFVGETDLRATQITVDTNPGYDDSSLVVYVGTEDGRILRLRPRLQIPSGPKSLLLEEIRVVKAETCSSGDLPCGVLALHVSRPNSSSQTNGISNPSPSLFVAFTDRVIQIPLSGCKQYASPECCNVDPDCGWKIDQCFDRTEQNRGSLQAMARMSVLPSNCQIKPEPTMTIPQNGYTELPVLQNSATLKLGTASSGLYVLVATLFFVLGAGLAILIFYVMYQRRRSYSIHSSAPAGQFMTSNEQLNNTQQGLEEAKPEAQYFDVNRKTSSTADRPTSLVHEIKVDRMRSEYAPLTPCSIDEREFRLNEAARGRVLENGDNRNVFLENSTPIFNQTKETNLIDEVDATLSSEAKRVDSILKLNEPFSEENVALDVEDSSVDLPALPLKQASLKTKYPSSESRVDHHKLLSQNTNNSNNNKNRQNQSSFSSLSEDHLLFIIDEESAIDVVPTIPLKPNLPEKPPPPKLGFKKQNNNTNVKPPLPSKAIANKKDPSSRQSTSNDINVDSASSVSEQGLLMSRSLNENIDIHALDKDPLINQ